jgi:hypothetical protein
MGVTICPWLACLAISESLETVRPKSAQSIVLSQYFYGASFSTIFSMSLIPETVYKG